MDNSIFIYTDIDNFVQIERFHLCTWEFNNNSSLVEFGFEVSKEYLKSDDFTIFIYIPWADKLSNTKDLYKNLCDTDNSRFIFNDSISGIEYLDAFSNDFGVIHKFNGRSELCILPTIIKNDEVNVVSLTLNLKKYNEYFHNKEKPNIYFRFCIKPALPFISMHKKGVSKSTIIYDIKVNERRNIPEMKINYFQEKIFCKIKYCFSFNILPNKYDIVFFDNTSLQNVRALEFESFNKYLGDNRVKKDELIVLFNKKRNLDSYSFFSIFSKERIGIGQFALAILMNIICGVLFFIPSYEISINKKMTFSNIPFEIFLAIGIVLVTLLYFVWPTIKNICEMSINWVLNKLNYKK